MLDIRCGVPQGSILGPLLYIIVIYVNDIHMACQSNIFSFADYTTLFLSNADVPTLYLNANAEIKKRYHWLVLCK